MKQTFTLLEDSPSPTMKKGDVVVEYHGCTFGLLREDEQLLGVDCMAVSKDGKTPFAIVPIENLQIND
jgi:hypothetical protein